MKYSKKILKKLIRETLAAENQEEDATLIIPKGKELFVGVSDDSELKPRKCYYGTLLWTTEDSSIAQMEIPISNRLIAVSTKHLISPSKGGMFEQIQKQLGIEYSDIEIKNNEISSYRMAPIFKEISDKHQKLWNSYYKLSEISKTYTKAVEDRKHKISKEFKEKWFAMLKKTDDAENELKAHNEDKLKNEIVNKKLEQLGYKPTQGYSEYNQDKSWDLKINTENGVEQIAPSNYIKVGKLAILIPKIDLKIFDITKLPDGSSYEEGTLEKKGFDGIKINSSSNTETMENFRHPSVGIFESSISKLNATLIPATHPMEFFKKNHITGDYQSDEYKVYKGKTASKA